jgi:hypothetical protein
MMGVWMWIWGNSTSERLDVYRCNSCRSLILCLKILIVFILIRYRKIVWYPTHIYFEQVFNICLYYIFVVKMFKTNRFGKPNKNRVSDESNNKKVTLEKNRHRHYTVVNTSALFLTWHYIYFEVINWKTVNLNALMINRLRNCCEK